MLEKIISGDYDSNLDKIISAVQTRRNILSQIKFLNFNVGDSIKFNSLVKPRYLIGQNGKIIEKRAKKVTIKLDDPPMAGRFNGGVIVTPVSLLEKA